MREVPLVAGFAGRVTPREGLGSRDLASVLVTGWYLWNAGVTEHIEEYLAHLLLRVGVGGGDWAAVWAGNLTRSCWRDRGLEGVWRTAGDSV